MPQPDRLQQAAEKLASLLFQAGAFRGISHDAVPANTDDTPIALPENSAGLDVIGVGYSNRQDAKEVMVFVRAAPQKLVKSTFTVDGFTSKFVKIGKTEVRPEAAFASNTIGRCYDHNGKIACGSSCAPSNKRYAGTFGAIVKSRTAEEYFALSNNHVFGDCNHVEEGMPIISPAGRDVTPVSPAPKTLFKHEKIIEIRSGNPHFVPKNRADAAIARVMDLNLVTSMQGGFFETPTTTTVPQVGLRVKKVGRTTELTEGTIIAKSVIFKLPYKSPEFNALAYYDEVFFIEPTNSTSFCAPGDSGSLVVDQNNQRAVGLLFAVTGAGYGVIAPIKPILDTFQIDLISGI